MNLVNKRNIILLLLLSSGSIFIGLLIIGVFENRKRREFTSDSIGHKYPQNYDFYSSSGVEDPRNFDSTSYFGSVEYECYGICFCESSERRTATRSSVSKSLTYIVVAVTSFVAYDSAKHYFESKCHEKMVDECVDDYSTIHSNVDSCEKVEPLNEEDESKRSTTKDGTGRKFMCEGTCIEREDLSHTLEIEKSKEICPTLHFSKKVHIFIEEDTSQTSQLFEKKAKEIFTTQYFDDICRERSIFIFQNKEVSLCVGRNNNNNNVQCRLLGKFSGKDDQSDRALQNWEDGSYNDYMNSIYDKDSLKDMEEDGQDFGVWKEKLGNAIGEDRYDESWFNTLSEKDRFVLENVYEIYIKWLEKNEGKLSPRERMSHLSKYHIIFNLKKWLEDGGDPRVFRKEL